MKKSSSVDLQEKNRDGLYGLDPKDSLESVDFATTENLYLTEYQPHSDDK